MNGDLIFGGLDERGYFMRKGEPIWELFKTLSVRMLAHGAKPKPLWVSRARFLQLWLGMVRLRTGWVTPNDLSILGWPIREIETRPRIWYLCDQI